jgi:formylglycine-generating enzyme required for sulfatase activity
MCRRVRKAVLAARPSPPRAVAPFDSAEARAHQQAWADYLNTAINVTNGDGMRLTLIPPGEFLMGSSDDQIAAALKIAQLEESDDGVITRIEKSERPAHNVVISKPFWIGATEVTVGQFKKFSAAGYVTDAERATTDPTEAAGRVNEAGSTYAPGYDVGENYPAAVTWNDAAAYCSWLSDREKTFYRLPTEAEWEYACRSGTTTQFWFSDDAGELTNFAWCNKNGSNQSHPVQLKKSNGFGLFDMHGNLFEWCADYHHESWYQAASSLDPTGPSNGYRRVLRGGAFGYDATYCRSAYRHYGPPTTPNIHFGFRCVRTIDVPPIAEP